MINVLVISDSFKGSLSSSEISALTLEKAKQIEGVSLKAVPFADGGEGSLESLQCVDEFHKIELNVPDAEGNEIKTYYLIQGTHAYIESALVVGLASRSGDSLNPYKTSSDGLGVLIKDAFLRGCRKITLFLGGTATVDAGTGMLRALGVNFLDTYGEAIPDGNPLLQYFGVSWYDFMNVFESVEFEVVADVENPLVGSNGGFRVYGPQKGLKNNTFEEIEYKATLLSTILNLKRPRKTPITAHEPASGAAGGMALSMLQYLPKGISSGYNWFSRRLKLEEMIAAADVVITGEGRIDSQTNMGKGVGMIARMCKKYKKPVYALCGELAIENNLFDGVFVLDNGKQSKQDAMSRAKELYGKQFYTVLEKIVTNKCPYS